MRNVEITGVVKLHGKDCESCSCTGQCAVCDGVGMVFRENPVTKERLLDHLAKLIHTSGLNVTLTVTIAEGEDKFAKMLSAGDAPPGPANPFNRRELEALLAERSVWEKP